MGTASGLSVRALLWQQLPGREPLPSAGPYRPRGWPEVPSGAWPSGGRGRAGAWPSGGRGRAGAWPSGGVAERARRAPGRPARCPLPARGASRNPAFRSVVALRSGPCGPCGCGSGGGSRVQAGGESAFFLADLVRGVTTEHASREQRSADLWCAGDGATSDICSHVCWFRKIRASRISHQQMRTPAESEQGRAVNLLPQQGSWAEPLGFCGPGL
eukprot:XP_005618281.1 uncharacterized protein LOC100855460 [Canis lupus familiaris]